MPCRVHVFAFFVVCVLLFECLYEIDAARVRTSRFRTRSSRRRVSPSRSRTKPKPKPKTFYSTVKKSDVLTKQKTFRQRFLVLAAFGVLSYKLNSAPVYGRRYLPYHSSNILIPRTRALRIQKEEYFVETKDGKRCKDGVLDLDNGNVENVVNVTTKISYNTRKGNLPMLSDQQMSNAKQTNLTLFISATEDYTVVVKIRTVFNESLLSGTAKNVANCTVLAFQSTASLVSVESYGLRNTFSLAALILAQFAFVISLVYVQRDL